jgi:lipooligosaccharide transport system permease protein
VTEYTLPLRPFEYWVAQYRRIWRGTLVTSFVTPVIFLFAFGWGLGQVADDSLALPPGISYLEFVAPGLLAASSMQIAHFESSWPVLSAIKWNRQYHAMLASPLRVDDVILGHQTYIALRILVTAIAYFVAITAFGAVLSPLGVLSIGVAVLVGLAFSAPISAWAAYTESEASFVAIFRFLILPMFLFSGAFFSVESLPLVFEWIAYLTPVWHGVDLSRQLTLGMVDATSAALHVAYLLAFATLGFLAARHTYRRRLLK